MKGLFQDRLFLPLNSSPVAFAVSVALHLVLLILLGISLSSSEVPRQKSSNKQTVKAFVVDASIVEQEMVKLKQAELNKRKKIQTETERLKKQLQKEKKRLADIKKNQRAIERKAAEEKKTEEKKAIARQKAEAEKQQAIAREKLETEKRIEKERQAAEKKKQEELAAQKRRQKEEEELKRKLQEEERRLAAHNDMLKSMRDQYVRLIEQKVERNWLRPVTVSSDYECEVFVTQSILGDVIDVRLGSCANDPVFRNSIERAVRKSSPLPPPPNPEVFDREIRFVFKPKV